MRMIEVLLRSKSPYAQGRNHNMPKERETADEYEKRTWRHRMHTTADGKVFIPPMALSKSLAEMAQYLAMKIPGKGSATYTKHFRQGINCLEAIELPLFAHDVPENWVFVPSGGMAGGGKRVWKCFGRIDQWEGKTLFSVVDDIVTPEIFRQHLELAGIITGIGVWRAQKGGMWGKFEVVSMEETKM